MGLFNWFGTDDDRCEDELHIDIESEREEAKDHIIYMLGGPVVKVEIDPLQLKHAVDLAQELLDFAGAEDETEYGILLKDGSLAYAKYMLGRLRIKYSVAADTKTISPSDGLELVREGLHEIALFRERLGLN